MFCVLLVYGVRSRTKLHDESIGNKKNQLRMFEELLSLIIEFVLMFWVSLIEIYSFWCALDHVKIVLFVAGL